MAKAFCIPQEVAVKLKAKAREGKFKIADLYDMSSQQRQDAFAEVVDRGTAQQINAAFEKAISKQTLEAQQKALKTWAENTFTGKSNQKKLSDVLTKINSLKEQGYLNPKSEKEFLSDLVAEKLGATVTVQEAEMIAKKATHLEELHSKLEVLGVPGVNEEGQIEYLKTRRDLEDYLDSLTPSGKLRVLTSTIARGNMLFRPASILVNINSNNIEGTIGAIVRRVGEQAVKGYNTREIGSYVRFNTKVFKQTGYDLSRMESLTSDRKILGEEIGTSQGKGLIRAVGRWYEDKVFNLTQGLPDVMASSAAFADRANLMATRLVRHEGLKGESAKLKAKQIMRDAMSVEPQTDMGRLVRQSARADAERSTNTDKRFLADRAMKFRQILNVKDLRFGDMEIPFVKTTANAIQSSLETSGITVAPETVVRMVKMVKLVYDGEKWGSASKESFSGFGEKMVRAGIGSLAAFLIANAIKKEDYVGLYPTNPSERELFKAKNAVANSIRINGKYYSLDWFGPLFAPIVGFLNAKKYGTDIPSSVYFYGSGVGYQILKTPGVDYARQSLDYLTKTLAATTTSTPDDIKKQIANYAVDFVKSRAIPGFLQTIAELTDNVVRDSSSKEDILAPLKSVIPGLRGSLPEKKTVFGDTISTEGIDAVIFGGRKKTAQDTPLISELDRLSSTGNIPVLTDVSQTSSKAKALKQQIGDERFKKAMAQYSSTLKAKFEIAIKQAYYKRADDEKKKSILDNIKDQQFDLMLRRNHYRKPKK